MAKRKGSSTSQPRTRSRAANEEREAREVENTQSLQRLDKLPKDVWEKIFDELDESDMFPLALSCRYFRQKLVEPSARTRQSGPRRVLRTNLRRKFWDGQAASAKYLRFCVKEEVSKYVERKKTRDVRCLAAYYGYLPLLQELLAGVTRLGTIMMDAAMGGQVEILQWLKTQKRFEDEYGWGLDSTGGPETFGAACSGGHLETMKWLRSEGCATDVSVCAGTAEAGQLETLKWLRSEGFDWDGLTCAWAARGGQFDILKYARANGCPWDALTCSCALKNGHLDIFKYARENGCPWDAMTCASAAEYGDLDVLKSLREKGCPWDESTCRGAAEYGHLHILKYAHENGCPWEENTCQIAAGYGHMDVLKYAREHGCPWGPCTWYFPAESTREWLKENDCPWEVLDLDEDDCVYRRGEYSDDEENW